MELNIKNLGPLTKGGTIDLDRRFYVFVGKNNSGKTYVANILWQLLKRINKHTNQLFFSETDFKENSIILEKDQYEKTLNSILFDQPWKTYNVPSSFFNKSTILVKKSWDKLYNKEFTATYLFSTYDNKYWQVNIKKDKESNKFSYTETALSKDQYKDSSDKSFSNPNITYVTTALATKEIKKEVIHYLSNDILTYSFQKGFSVKAMFLPTDRAFLTTFWKYVLRTQKDLLDEAAEMRLSGENNIDHLLKVPYTDSTNEVIKLVEHLDRTQPPQKKEYEELLNELEELMGGSIKLSSGKEGGLGRMEIKFVIKDSDKELDMHMASSSVNQITLIYLYLKYWAKESNNFLIIDEPEENLHPENQLKLMKILAKFADRNNNRVLITTHSTLMTDVINNYVRLGYLKDKGVDTSALTQENNEHQLSALQELTHKDFGVYYFNGDAIQEYKVGDYGVAFKDFNRVENNVKATANELNDLIFDLLNKE